MSDQIIQLTSQPNQTFSVQLVVNGQPLTMYLAVSYSAMAGYWQMAISDATGAQLVASVPLITGWFPAANILGQYGYLLIGAAYLLNTGNAPDDYPGPNNLELFSLLWGDNA